MLPYFGEFLMRVLLVSDFFEPRYGGIATHVKGLAKALKEQGKEAIVLTSAGDVTCIEEVDGIKVIRARSRIFAPATFGIRATRERVSRVIKAVKPDIVHAHHPFAPMSLAVPRVCKKYDIPCVVTNHFTPPWFKKLNFFWRASALFIRNTPPGPALKYYTKAIAVNPYGAKYFFYIIRKPVYYIPNAVFVREIYCDKKWRIEIDGWPKVLIVARGSVRKGFELAFKAFKYLTYKYPDAKLIIAGPTGWTYKYLNKLAKILEIEKNLVNLGFVPREKLFCIYEQSDILLNTTYGGESFPTVYLEAMALGIPILTTAGEESMWILRKSGAGIALGRTNSKVLGINLIRLIQNEELRKEMSKNGKKFVWNYDWSRIVVKIIKVYEEAIDEHYGRR